MDEKRHSTLITVPGERCHIGNIGVLSRGQACLGLTKSLSSRFEVLVLIKGDPSKTIDDIENVETVFKAGVGYDSKKLIESVRGQVGIR